MLQATYRFFDSAFRLETDSPDFLSRFDAAYRRLRVAEEPAAPLVQVLLHGRPRLTMGEQTLHSADGEALETYALNAILNSAAAQVRSHFLFHAAALRGPGGQGVLLAGGSGLGKTTLTQELLRRGWGFFSDDVAAVERASAWLHPFPRSLGVRVAGDRPGVKRMVAANSVADACPARFLFVLADPGDSGLPEEPWYLLLDRVDDRIVTRLNTIEGVRGARVEREEPYSVVRLDLAAGAQAAQPEIEAVCRRHGALLFDMVRGRERPPDFGKEPRLSILSAQQAGRELLRCFKGGHRAAVLRYDYGGSAARLYLALTGLASNMICMRMSVGRLESMVEAIACTVEQKAAERSGRP